MTGGTAASPDRCAHCGGRFTPAVPAMIWLGERGPYHRQCAGIVARADARPAPPPGFSRIPACQYPGCTAHARWAPVLCVPPAIPCPFGTTPAESIASLMLCDRCIPLVGVPQLLTPQARAAIEAAEAGKPFPPDFDRAYRKRISIWSDEYIAAHGRPDQRGRA